MDELSLELHAIPRYFIHASLVKRLLRFAEKKTNSNSSKYSPVQRPACFSDTFIPFVRMRIWRVFLKRLKKARFNFFIWHVRLRCEHSSRRKHLERHRFQFSSRVAASRVPYSSSRFSNNRETIPRDWNNRALDAKPRVARLRRTVNERSLWNPRSRRFQNSDKEQFSCTYYGETSASIKNPRRGSPRTTSSYLSLKLRGNYEF